MTSLDKKYIQFLLILIINCIIQFSEDLTNYYYDASNYVAFSNLFEKNGVFSFVNFDEKLRGYFFPFLIFIFDKIISIFSSDSISGLRLFYILFFTFFQYYLVDKFIKYYFKVDITKLDAFIIGFIVQISYFGLILYPLSDFFSLLFSVIGFVLLRKNDIRIKIISPVFLLAAYYTRPSYLICFIFIYLVIIILIYRSKNSIIFRLFLFLCCNLLLSVLYIPQIQINEKIHNRNSIFLYSKQTNGEDLYLWQLKTGLEMQKYETYVGSQFSIPGLVYWDPIGKTLKRDTDIMKADSYIEFLNIVSKHPFDYSYLLIKHFYSGLLVQNPGVYLKRMNPFSEFFLIIWAIIYILFIISFTSAPTIHFFNSLSLFIFISPALLSIPGAVEERFFVSVNFLVLCKVFSAKNHIYEYVKVKSNLPIILIISTLVISILFLVIGGNNQNLAIRPILFSDF